MAKVANSDCEANFPRNIRWTKEAFLWLQDIHSHISNDSLNIANKVVDEIFEKAQILEDFPKVGYKYENRENVRTWIHIINEYLKNS